MTEVEEIFFKNNEGVDYGKKFNGVVVEIVSKGYLLHKEAITEKIDKKDLTINFLDENCKCILGLDRETDTMGDCFRKDLCDSCEKYECPENYKVEVLK